MTKSLTFIEAVKICLNKYATFKGRARRSEYWWWYLAMVLLNIIVYFIGSTGLSYIVSLAFIIPNLAVAMRRLHDIGKSGWFILIGLIPLIGAIILIVWFCQQGENQANAYGENPRK